MIQYHDTILISLLINYGATSDFYIHVVYNISYDTLIINSLISYYATCEG
jgi:hypothetical protein